MDVNEVRDRLIRKTCYIAADDLPARVHWQKAAKCSVLVEGSEEDGLSKEGVELTIIARISRKKFFLLPDANWSRKLGRPLSTAKASCIMEDCGLEETKGDMKKGWQNLVSIIRAALKSYKVTKSVKGVVMLDQDGKEDNDFTLRVVHHLFLKKKFKGNQQIPSYPGKQYSCENWPAGGEEAREELQRMSGWVPYPFKAYNTDNNLIEPEDWEAKLLGATVRLHFNLAHWIIDDDHIFTADIAKIKVLEEGISMESMVKRKIDLVDTFDEDSEDDRPLKKRKGEKKKDGEQERKKNTGKGAGKDVEEEAEETGEKGENVQLLA